MIAIAVLPLSYLICAAYVICPVNARVINKRAAFYIANETMCIVDGEVFRNGDPVPTDDHCERCTCRPPGFSCVLRDCEVKPGCKAVRRAGECCPEYVCGCVHSGNIYEDGEIIRDIQNPCYTCRCHGSSISCVFADCLFRGDCVPEYVVGECCPRYDHCPPLSTTPVSTVFTTSFTKTSSPQEDTKNTLITLTTLHLEKFTGDNASISIEDIQFSPSTTSISESTTLSTTLHDEAKVTVKFSLETTTDSPAEETGSTLLSTLSSWLSAFTTKDSTISYSGVEDSVSTVQYSEPTVQSSNSTEKYSDFTEMYSASTEKDSVSTEKDSASTEKYSTFTEKYSESTEKHSESTEKYSDSTKTYSESTIHTSEPTIHTSEPTVHRLPTSGFTLEYSEPTVHTSESTIQYSEPTVRTNGSTIQYSELTVHSSESTEKYSESTEKYSESTEKYSESTEKYSESTEEDSESTKKYNGSTVGSSEPSVESSRSTIGYGELSVHSSESTEKYGETVHGGEYTEKYNEITVESSAPTVEGSEPKVQTSGPTVEGSEPTAQSSEPTAQGSKLTAQSSETTLQSSETTLQSNESTVEYSEPTVQSSESTTRNSQAAIYNTQPTRQDSEHVIQDGEPVTKDKESTIQDSEFTTRLVNVSETSESIISTLSSADSSSTDRTITGISALWTSSNAATEKPVTSLDDTKIHINTSSASTIYFEDNITSFEKLSNETVHIITEYVTPSLSETISPSILFGEKTYSPNAENDPVEIKTEIPIDISTTQSDVLINDKVALHDDARPEISLATSQEISTTQKTKEKSTTHEATEKSTTQGTTEESITYEITEKSTTEGLTETSTTQRTTEKLTTQRPTEKLTTQRPTEKSTVQGTSEKSTIQGTSEKSTIQGTSEKAIDPETTERVKIQEATDNMTTQEIAEMMTTHGNTEKMTAQKTPDRVITQETTERMTTQENTEWRTTNQENTHWRTTNQENTQWRTTNQENTQWRTTNQENTKKLTMEPESTEKLALAEESTEKSTTLLIDSKPFSNGGISTSIQGIVTETKEVNRNSEFPISVIVEITSSDSSLKTGSSSQMETSTESTITSRPTITNSDEKIRPRSTTSEEETKTSSGIFKPDRTTSSHSHVDETEIRTTIMFSKLTEKTASTEETTIADLPKIVDIATTFINDEEFVISKTEMPDNQSIFTLPTIEDEFTTTEILKLEHQNTPKEAISSTFEKAESSMTTKNLEELTKKKTFTKTSILADDETSYFALTETPNEEIKDEKTLAVSLFTASSQLNSVTEEAISNTHTDQVFNLSTIAPQEKSSLKHDATDITEQWPNDTEVDISPIATTFPTLPTIETKSDFHTISTKVFKSPTSETVIDVISSTASQTPHSILEEEAKTYSEEESIETITTDLFDTTHVQTEQFSNPKLTSTVAYSAEKDFITEVSLKDKTITSFANNNWMPNNFTFSEDSSTLSTDESTMSNSHGLIKDDTTLLADETIADVYTVIADIGKSSTTHHSTIKEEMETDTSPQTTEIIKYLTNKHSTYGNAGQTTDSLHENEKNDSVFTFEDTMLNSTEKMELESFDFEATYNSTNESILIVLDPIEIITDTIISGSSLAPITSDVEIEPITEASLMPTLVNEKNNFSTISSESDVSSPSLLHETKIMPDLLTTKYPLAESEKEITMKSNSTVSPSVKEKTQVADVFFDVFEQNNLSLSTQKSDELFPRTTKDNDEQLTSISSTDTIETKTLSLTEISKDDIFTAMTTDFEVPTTKNVADIATSFASEEVEGNATTSEHVTSSEKVLPETGSQVAFEISANRSSDMPSVTAVEITHHTMSTIPITEDDSLHIKTDETTSGVELSKTENQYSSILSNDEHISTKGNPETMYKVTWIATNIATTDKTTSWKTYDSTILTDGETQKADTASEIYLEDYTTDSRKVETNVTPITSFSSDLITDMGGLDPVTNIEHISSESDSSLHADISIRTSKGIDTTTAVPLTTELISAYDRSTSITSEVEVLFKESPTKVDKNVSPEVQNLQTKATTHINADKTHDGFSPETTTDIRENTVSTNEDFPSTTTIHKRLVLRQTTSASSDTTMFDLPDETSINPNYNHNATSLIIRNVTDGQNIKGSSTTIVEDNDITQASTVTNLSEPTEKLQKDNPHLVKASSQINNYTPTTYESKQDDNESVNPEDYSSLSSAIPAEFASAESSTDAEQEEAYNSQTTLTSHNAKPQTETGAYSTVREHTTLGVVHDNELPENETTTKTSSSIFGFDNLPLDEYYHVDYENSNESSVDDILDSINLDRLGESIIIELMKGSENTTNRNENETSEYLKDQTDGLDTTQHVSTSPVITEVPTSDSSKESATIDNAHVFAENFHLAIEKEIDNIDNETLHVELNDTANLRGVSDVWYGTETEFESHYTAKEIDVNRSSIDIITDEYIPGNEDGEVLQDDTQSINSSHISEFKNINPNVQKEGKFTTNLYEKSKITTTEYPPVEENFTKKESHIKSDVEKTVPPNSLNLETTKESVIFKEIGDFITTESPISISSSEHKLKEEIQTTKQSASATITLTENFEDMSTVAPSTMTGIPLQTRNALGKTTGSIGHLTKEDGDSLLIESVSTNMVTDVSTVEIQTTRTDFSESESTPKFYDSEIMEDHKFQNQDVANVIGSTFTHSDNSEVTTLSLTRTISEEISNETTFYSNENITSSTINLNISVNGEPISLADEETKEGPEKGGEWFEPTLYGKLSNIYETSTTSIKIPEHLTTSESEIADESMTSKLETIHQPTTTVQSAPITYDGIVNGPEKGGEWFEPTFPALLPYSKDSSKEEDGKKTQINLTDHLTTESSKFMTAKINEALSEKTTRMFLSESILLKHDARSTVVEDFEDTFSERTTETMTPSSILDTNNSQKLSIDKSLFPLPMLHRTQHDKNTLNPVYIKESPEKNINPEVDITQESEAPISEKLATTDFETEKAITKPSVASVFPTTYEEVSNETTKPDEIGSSEPTTTINKKLSKIYHILLSKDPASDLEVSSMNKSGDSLAKDQFFDLPQDIPLIEGFAVKSGDFFAVTSSLIVVDPGEKSKNKAALQNSTEITKPSTDSFTTDNSTIQTDSTNPYGNPAQNSSTLLEIISRVTTSDSINNQSSTSIVTEKGWVGS